MPWHACAGQCLDDHHQEVSTCARAARYRHSCVARWPTCHAARGAGCRSQHQVMITLWWVRSSGLQLLCWIGWWGPAEEPISVWQGIHACAQPAGIAHPSCRAASAMGRGGIFFSLSGGGCREMCGSMTCNMLCGSPCWLWSRRWPGGRARVRASDWHAVWLVNCQLCTQSLLSEMLDSTCWPGNLFFIPHVANMLLFLATELPNFTAEARCCCRVWHSLIDQCPLPQQQSLWCRCGPVQG